MPDVILSTIGGAGSQFFDNNGNVLSGGLLYTYAGGTTTPAATYTDSTGTVARANPVVLDSAGRVPDNGIWVVYGTQYKFVLKTSADVTIGTWDQFPGSIISGKITTLQAEVDAIEVARAAIANCFVRAVRATTNQALLANSTTKLQYNSEVADVGGDYDPTTYEFTAPATGTYVISAAAYFVPDNMGSAGNKITLEIYKDGSYAYDLGYTELEASTGVGHFVNGSIPVQLSTGEKISIYAVIVSADTWIFSIDQSALVITRIS